MLDYQSPGSTGIIVLSMNEAPWLNALKSRADSQDGGGVYMEHHAKVPEGKPANHRRSMREGEWENGGGGNNPKSFFPFKIHHSSECKSSLPHFSHPKQHPRSKTGNIKSLTHLFRAQRAANLTHPSRILCRESAERRATIRRRRWCNESMVSEPVCLILTQRFI